MTQAASNIPFLSPAAIPPPVATNIVAAVFGIGSLVDTNVKPELSASTIEQTLLNKTAADKTGN